jgi:uracil-DNA glycosylase family protein
MVMAVRQLKSAQPFVPSNSDLSVLEEAARTCEGCDLYRHATQTVFGEGKSHARIFFVGEQPGDQEDVAGRPFVGPAGQILDQALADAGINRRDTYVTNAVKHFKFVERGKRRIHEKPNSAEIAACRPWLEAEIKSVEPKLLVALGATAGRSIFGRAVKVNAERGKLVPHAWAESALLTVHPSFLLRLQDPESREKEYSRFVDDLKIVRLAL